MNVFQSRRRISGPFALLLSLLTLRVFSATLPAQELFWPDPVASHVVPQQSTAITHGPVLGNVRAKGVRVWIRADREVELEVLTHPQQPPFDDVATQRFSSVTKAAHDFTGFAELRNFQPNTVYVCGVQVNGKILDSRQRVQDPWPTDRTLPDDTSHAFQLGMPCHLNRQPKNATGLDTGLAECPASDSGSSRLDSVRTTEHHFRQTRTRPDLIL